MTETEARALTVGAPVKDNGPGVGVVTEKHIDFFSIRWTAPPERIEGVSTFMYDELRHWPQPIFDYSFWSDTYVPTVTGNATLPINVCCIVTPAVVGTITAVQFWKISTDTGTHMAQVWNPAGSATLATGTFAGETATGWQTLTLGTPATLVGGQTYRVCVSHQGGQWACINGGFAGTSVPGVISMSSQAYYAAGSTTAYPGGDAPVTWFGVDVVFKPS